MRIASGRRRAVRWGGALSILAAAALAPAAPVPAAEPPSPPAVATLDRAVLAGGTAPVLRWRFRAGDDPAWAAPGLDDSGWIETGRSVFRRDRPPPHGWTGVGWLRATVRVAPEAVGAPVALSLDQQGAAEVFLDGRRIGEIGTVGADARTTVPRRQEVPLLVVFDRPGDHVVAVRFVNHHVGTFLRTLGSAGVAASFAAPDAAFAATLATGRFFDRALGGFCGLFLAFGLLHLLLFVFHREIRANLDFAALCFVLAGLVFLLAYRVGQPDPRFVLVAEPALNVLGLASGWFSLRFVYRVFRARPPVTLWVYGALALGVAAWGVAVPATAGGWVFLTMLAAAVETARAVVVAMGRRQPGARLLGLGVLVQAGGFASGLLAYLGVGLPRTSWTVFLVPFLSFVVLLVTMSIYLSRRFAALSAELVEKSLLEERYAQKVRELEEARELQLSMLPRRLPELPDLDLAAHMETATEVGGDYYDFALDADGALVLAVGDATGHGMRAGTMVTATKGIFSVLSGERPLSGTLSRSTRAIKRMNLPKLAMALTLVRYREGALAIAAAGMPPALVHRAATGEVEQVLLGGTPLGAMASFPYREAEVPLAPGDTVLLASDGFPERLDPAGEPLGYERATALFVRAAGRPAAEVVAELRRGAEAWADGRPADDDVTFVVLKVREAAAR